MTAGRFGVLASAWRSWLFDHALPTWSEKGVIAKSGGFEEAIGRDGHSIETPLRARVQAREVYVFTTAGALGWTGPWRRIVRNGLALISDAFRRPDDLYRATVSRDGMKLDDTARLYDQAFFLFARAAVARAEPSEAIALESAGLVHLDALEAHFAHRRGGYRESSETAPFQSNPHMHLLEASLPWEELTSRARWADIADKLVGLCLSRFIDVGSGALREFLRLIFLSEIRWNRPGRPWPRPML